MAYPTLGRPSDTGIFKIQPGNSNVQPISFLQQTRQVAFATYIMFQLLYEHMTIEGTVSPTEK